jgi:hypothetical protein
MSVEENLIMGTLSGEAKANRSKTMDRVYGLFPRLRERQKQLAGTLSGGEQQMLAVARTLMGNPELVLMDEPSEGLAPLIVRSLMEAVRTLRDQPRSIPWGFGKGGVGLYPEVWGWSVTAGRSRGEFISQDRTAASNSLDRAGTQTLRGLLRLGLRWLANGA